MFWRLTLKRTMICFSIPVIAAESSLFVKNRRAVFPLFVFLDYFFEIFKMLLNSFDVGPQMYCLWKDVVDVTALQILPSAYSITLWLISTFKLPSNFIFNMIDYEFCGFFRFWNKMDEYWTTKSSLCWSRILPTYIFYIILTIKYIFNGTQDTRNMWSISRSEFLFILALIIALE